MLKIRFYPDDQLTDIVVAKYLRYVQMLDGVTSVRAWQDFRDNSADPHIGDGSVYAEFVGFDPSSITQHADAARKMERYHSAPIDEIPARLTIFSF